MKLILLFKFIFLSRLITSDKIFNNFTLITSDKILNDFKKTLKILQISTELLTIYIIVACLYKSYQNKKRDLEDYKKTNYIEGFSCYDHAFIILIGLLNNFYSENINNINTKIIQKINNNEKYTYLNDDQKECILKFAEMNFKKNKYIFKKHPDSKDEFKQFAYLNFINAGDYNINMKPFYYIDDNLQKNIYYQEIVLNDINRNFKIDGKSPISSFENLKLALNIYNEIFLEYFLEEYLDVVNKENKQLLDLNNFLMNDLDLLNKYDNSDCSSYKLKRIKKYCYRHLYNNYQYFFRIIDEKFTICSKCKKKLYKNKKLDGYMIDCYSYQRVYANLEYNNFYNEIYNKLKQCSKCPIYNNKKIITNINILSVLHKKFDLLDYYNKMINKQIRKTGAENSLPYFYADSKIKKYIHIIKKKEMEEAIYQNMLDSLPLLNQIYNKYFEANIKD